jgi:hypothetical protein
MPKTALFLENQLFNREVLAKIDSIDAQLENILSVEKSLTSVEHLQIHNMQAQMGKIHHKYLSEDREMSFLDATRLLHFQARIAGIYEGYEPSAKDFVYAEKLMDKRELLITKLA